ncbi:MAG TPA: SDR family oxidoreductase [Tepidisphaeraceae bacterium]|nr:SDR family oxidoreductase [Tepidisphaeraceae bacterium]
MRLEGKSILVVGGTTGLGLAAARACVREGARLTIVGRDEASTKSAAAELGSDVAVLTGDAVDPITSERAVALAVERFGRLDGVYHVAGGSGRSRGDGPLHEITDDGWQYTFDLNLRSVFNSNRAAVRQFMAQRSGGAVLNLGSVAAFFPSPRFFATHAYAAAKAAIEGITRSCAAYYAKQQIRFNAIAPGAMNTPMAQRAAQDEQILRFLAAKQPLDGGRIGKPEDLDEAVIYLLSDGAKFVTGQVFAVDGGWSVSEGID